MRKLKPEWLEPFPKKFWDVRVCEKCGMWLVLIPRIKKLFEAEPVDRSVATAEFNAGRDVLLLKHDIRTDRAWLKVVTSPLRLAGHAQFLRLHECEGR